MNTKKSYGFGGMKIDTLYADNTPQGFPSSLNAQMYQRQNQMSDSQAFEPKIASNFAKSLTTELVKNESGGNYNAEPRDKKTGKLLSSATGKYQFLWNTWKNEIKKVTGIDNKEEFKGNPQAQDKFYNDYYLPNKLMPAVQRLKRQYDTDLSDKQLGLLYHFRGEGGAGAYLQGKVIDKPESYNKPISAYIGKFAFGGSIDDYNKLVPKDKKGMRYYPTAANFANKEGKLSDNIDGMAGTGQLKDPIYKREDGRTFTYNKELRKFLPTFTKDKNGNYPIMAGIEKDLASLVPEKTKKLIRQYTTPDLHSNEAKLAKKQGNLADIDKAYGLHLIGGNPKIKNDVPLNNEGGRAYYDPEEHALHLSKERLNTWHQAYLPELAHAYQFSTRKNNIYGVPSKPVSNNKKDYDNNEYSREGSEEYQAHKIIDNDFSNILYRQKPQDKELYKELLKSARPSMYKNLLTEDPEYTVGAFENTNDWFDEADFKVADNYEKQRIARNKKTAWYRIPFSDMKLTKTVKASDKLMVEPKTTNSWGKAFNLATGFNVFAYGGNVKKHGFGNFLSNNTSAVGSGLGFISSGINSMNTTDNPNMALSGVSGALSGAAAGAAFGPIGMGVGALVGGVSSLFGADAQRKQYQEAMRKKNMAEMNTLKQNSESVLSTYNSKGITGKYSYFAEGGETNENNQVYEVEGKEVVQGQSINIPNAKQIANDMVVVKGARHEEGGVKGQGGERVFSDRLFVPNEFHKILEKTGFKPKEDSTFAAVAQLLGKHKGEAEIKSKTFDFIKANTAKLNLQKTTGLIDTLFMIQEGLKEKHPELVKPIFGYGGTIKMAFGGYGASNVPKPKPKRKTPTLFLDTAQQAFKSKIARIDGEEGQANYKPEVLPNLLGFLSPIATPKNAWGDSTIMPAISKKIAPTNLPTIPTINPTYIEPMKGKKHGGRGLGIGDGISSLLDNIRNNPESVDYATAGIGYLNDLKTINSMNTTAPRRLQQAVDLNYNDRSGIAIASNRADFRNYIASNFNSGVGNQQAYVNTLKANNNVYNNENERRDNAIDNNRRTNLQINAGNLATMQQADEREIGLKNEQLSQRGQAFNSLLSNINAIRSQSSERGLDKDRMALIRDTYNIKGNGSIDYRISELRKKRNNGTISANELRILNTFDN